MTSVPENSKLKTHKAANYWRNGIHVKSAYYYPSFI